MHGGAGHDERMIVLKLGAEVETFLAIGLARGQLPAQGEVASPRSAAQGHADLKLLVDVLREKFSAQSLQAPLQRTVYSMTDDIKEPLLPAGLPDLGGHAISVLVGCTQRADIDNR